MMSKHPSEVDLVDLLEEGAEPGLIGHVSECLECRERLGELQQGLELARELPAPEPPPLFYQALRRNVRRETGRPAAPRGLAGFWAYGAAAAAALAMVALLLPGQGPNGTAGEAVAWSSLPPTSDDVGLQVLSALDLDDELSAVVECGWPSCLAELTPEERQAVAEDLREELQGRAL
jgi:hypothetical protein